MLVVGLFLHDTQQVSSTHQVSRGIKKWKKKKKI